MDDTPCRRFFLKPLQPLHRRYAALRAFFVDGQTLPTIADQFRLSYHTLRSWLRDFRADCRAGRVPPFLPSHAWDDPPAAACPESCLKPKRRLPRIAGVAN
jgi:Homeodomain-like domain